jgi:hypothetical protein
VMARPRGPGRRAAGVLRRERRWLRVWLRVTPGDAGAGLCVRGDRPVAPRNAPGDSGSTTNATRRTSPGQTAPRAARPPRFSEYRVTHV